MKPKRNALHWFDKHIIPAVRARSACQLPGPNAESHVMNIREFAAKAGVSTATVSRAFHEGDKLRAVTRERILKLAQDLAYYPNPSGRTLVRGRYDVLGVIWPLEVEGADAAFAQRILAALTSALVANDLDLLVCPLDRSEQSTVTHATRTIQRSRCDAWILLYPRPEDPLIPFLQRAGKPVVALMGANAARSPWKCVRLNQRGWIEDALRRLKMAGCRSVALFGSRDKEPDHAARLEAFEELAPRFFRKSHVTVPGWPPKEAELKALLASARCDAVIGVDDRAALMALDICQQLRLAVPGKVKVVGIDDIPLSRFSLPPLSTYHQPLNEMAQCAVDLALGKRSKSCTFEARFVPRETLPAMP